MESTPLKSSPGFHNRDWLPSQELSLLKPIDQTFNSGKIPNKKLIFIFVFIAKTCKKKSFYLPWPCPTWREEASYAANHQYLAGWLANPDVLALGMPSAVVVESFNYPRHPAYARIEIAGTSPFNIDPRLWPGNPLRIK